MNENTVEIKVSRFCVGIDVFDNETGEQLMNTGINVSTAYGVIDELEKAIAIIKEKFGH